LIPTDEVVASRVDMLQDLGVELSELSTYEIFCISVYIESMINPSEMALDNIPVIFTKHGVLEGLLADGEQLYTAYTTRNYQANINMKDSLPSAYVDEYMAGNGLTWDNLTLKEQSDYATQMVDDYNETMISQGHSIAGKYDATIIDDQAYQLGAVYSYITDTMNDGEKKKAAEQEAIAKYGATELETEYFYAKYSTVTCLITERGQLSETEKIQINTVIAEEMLRANLGAPHDDANMQELRDWGLDEVVSFIEDRRKGCYFEVPEDSEEAVEHIMQEIISDDVQINEWQEKVDIAAVTDQRARENSDFEDVIAQPISVNADWNPYAALPSTDAIYTAVQAGYRLNQGHVNQITSQIEQLDLLLANGEINREKYDDIVAPLQSELENAAQVAGGWYGYNFITKEMYDTFTYLYVKSKESGDNTAFREYFNIFKEELTNAQWNAYYGVMNDLVNEKGPWGEILSGVAAVGGKIAAPVAYLETGIDALAGQEVNTSSQYQLLAQSGGKFSELAASTTNSAFGKWVIQTSIDLVASAPAFAMNPVAGAAYMGLQSAGQDAAQQNLRGVSAWESLAHSTVMGGITFFSSLVMLKGFGKIMAGTTVPATLLQKIMTYGLNAIEAFGLGGVTGAVGTLTGNLADMLMAGDHSNYAYRVYEYMNREEGPLTEDEAKTAAAVDLFLKEPIEAGLKNGAIAAVMSIPGTAGAIRSAETLGGRAAVADEQSAFETLRTLEEAPGGVKSNVSQGMSLLEQINARLRQESGIANSSHINTEAANNALMDYLSGKGSATAAAEAFGKVANEAIASGSLTAAEISALEGYVGTTQMYVDAMGLLGIMDL